MFDIVKENLNEIIQLSNGCPTEYREKCFEVLLNALVSNKPDYKSPSPDIIREYIPATTQGKPVSNQFFNQFNINEEQWQKVFFYDGTSWKIIVHDLKENAVSKKQTKLALLAGVKSILEGQDSYFTKEVLRELCAESGALDRTNFATYMKNLGNAIIEKDEGWKLTIPGRQMASDVIKELSQ